jgi:1,4-alpha-glucan branching enzyme
MGEELCSTRPFPFFCDFDGDLARAVTEGRRGEFARFDRFADPAARAAIPDPNAAATFESARIDWVAASGPAEIAAQAYLAQLLGARRARIMPLIPAVIPGAARFEVEGDAVLRVDWRLSDGGAIALLANLSSGATGTRHDARGTVVCAQPAQALEALRQRRLPPWSVVWTTSAP